MTHDNDLAETFKFRVLQAMAEAPVSYETVQATLLAEGLLLAAVMHHGNDASFLAMARRALALVRTGEIEQ